jgi:hypothetical protein
MSSAGTYEERLPCGGSLKVSSSSWGVTYYFPGGTARHNGTFFTIEGVKIQAYIEAFRENWKELESLKAAIPAGGEFTKTGRMNMTIRISSFAPGVCLHYHHLPMNSSSQIEKVVRGYEYAIQRAPVIQAFLRTL